MKRCPKCNRAFTDPTIRFCLEDGEVLVDAGASSPYDSPYDSQATLVLPETNASRPEFSVTRDGQSGSQPSVAPDFSQRGQSTQRLPVMQGRNYTVWIFIAFVILGLAGVTGYFLLRSREADRSQKIQAMTSPTSQASSSTPPMSATPQTETSVAVEKQTNQTAMPTEPAVGSSAPEAHKAKPESVNDSQTKMNSTETASADESNRPRKENVRKTEPENDIGKSRANGFFEITIENAWVSTKAGPLELCGYRASDEQRAVFVRFTIRALSDSLPDPASRTEDFLLIDDSGRRIETTCGDGRFYSHSFTGEKQKTITLVYTVRREPQHLIFRFQRVGSGDAITFDLSGLG